MLYLLSVRPDVNLRLLVSGPIHGGLYINMIVFHLK